MRNFQMAWRATCLALLLMLMCAGPTGAQTTLGRVAGTVLDESGGVLPGATITLTNMGTGQVQTTVSSETGAFLFPQVPVGTYKVNITLEGFKAADYTDVSVAVGQEVLADGEAGDRRGQRSRQRDGRNVARQDDDAGSDATVLQQQVLDIPLANRDVTNLIKLQPGVPGVHQPRPTRASTAGVRRGRR